MAKRFTDTEKWKDPWHRRLNPVAKCFWDYICSNCDNAGVWKIDWDLATFYIGSEINESIIDIINSGKNRLKVFGNGELLLIVGHASFQCGNLLSEKLTNLQKNAINLISQHIKNKGLTRDDFYLTGKLPVANGYRYKGIGIGKGKGSINKEKILKEEIKINTYNSAYLQDPLFKEAFGYFIEMRTKKNKKPTERAKELILRKLEKETIERAIAMLDQSTKNSWTDIYPLKDTDLMPQERWNKL